MAVFVFIWNLTKPLFEPCSSICRLFLQLHLKPGVMKARWCSVNDAVCLMGQQRFSLYMRKVRDMVENPHSGIPGKIFACSSISFIAVTAVSHCISTVLDVRGEEDWVNAAFLRVQCVLHCYPLREGDMQDHSINQADIVFGIQVLWLP